VLNLGVCYAELSYKSEGGGAMQAGDFTRINLAEQLLLESEQPLLTLRAAEESLTARTTNLVLNRVASGQGYDPTLPQTIEAITRLTEAECQSARTYRTRPEALMPLGALEHIARLKTLVANLERHNRIIESWNKSCWSFQKVWPNNQQLKTHNLESLNQEIELATNRLSPELQARVKSNDLYLLSSFEHKDSKFIPVLKKILAELESRPRLFETEGLLRLSGDKKKIENARDQLKLNPDKLFPQKMGPHDLTGLIKELVKNLESPILNSAPIFEDDFKGMDQAAKSTFLKKYLSGLTPKQMEIFSLLMQKLLIPVLKMSAINKMTDTNLVITFSLTLFGKTSPRPTTHGPIDMQDLKSLAIDTNAWLFKALLAHYQG